VQPVSAKGFFSSLFDYSFSSLITTRIVKVVYVIVTVVFSLMALGYLIFFISRGGAGIIVGIIVVPIAWLLYMIWARITLEVLIVIFRIGDDVRAIAGTGAVPPYGYQRPEPPGAWRPQGATPPQWSGWSGPPGGPGGPGPGGVPMPARPPGVPPQGAGPLPGAGAPVPPPPPPASAGWGRSEGWPTSPQTSPAPPPASTTPQTPPSQGPAAEEKEEAAGTAIPPRPEGEGPGPTDAPGAT
jgi:TM2 domain-containing membrane protein YozV